MDASRMGCLEVVTEAVVIAGVALHFRGEGSLAVVRKGRLRRGSSALHFRGETGVAVVPTGGFRRGGEGFEGWFRRGVVIFSPI
jgi:hypothetical protein